MPLLEPTPTPMQTARQQTQCHGGMSWAQYAHCKDMTQFRDLKPPGTDEKSSTQVDEQNPDKKKQDQETFAMANEPDDRHPSAKPTNTTRSGSATTLQSKKIPSTFGNPSPVRHGPKKPLWIRSNAEVAEVTLYYPQRPLDGLYLRYPEKKLEANIEPSTINLAAGVILQVVNESAYQWFKRWCPDMDLREVFENISGKVKEEEEGELVRKRYEVPLEAIDTSNMASSLADMYRHCRNVYPKDSRDSE